MNRISTYAAFALSGALAFAPALAPLASAQSNAPTAAGVDVHMDLHPMDAAVKANIGAHAQLASTTTHAMKKGMKTAQDRIDAAAARGGTLVDARVSMLQKLETRISGMKRLSTSEKDSLSTDITAQINELVSLKAKIGGDTSTSSVIADIKAIRPDYRSFLLTLPRAALMAAADRELDIAAQMDVVGSKLDARIDDAKNGGTDVSAAASAYDDFKDKVADAKVQAQAALDLVKDLKADGGDATVRASNMDALKNARVKVKMAREDLTAARKGMATIMQGLGVHVEAQASSTANLK